MPLVAPYDPSNGLVRLDNSPEGLVDTLIPDKYKTVFCRLDFVGLEAVYCSLNVVLLKEVFADDGR